jgi:aspartyl-tRNA(Asn)/glutamyl-tRNA(Gln) amidotransferase subunit C
MSVDKQTVEQIAHLARLSFDEQSLENMIQDMNRMIAFVDKLNELPTEGVQPLIYMVEESNVLREDEVKQIIRKEDGLKNAPKHDSDYFRVPKVIDQANA